LVNGINNESILYFTNINNVNINKYYLYGILDIKKYLQINYVDTIIIN